MTPLYGVEESCVCVRACLCVLQARYQTILDLFRAGEKDVNVTVLSAMGTDMIQSTLPSSTSM